MTNPRRVREQELLEIIRTSELSVPAVQKAIVEVEQLTALDQAEAAEKLADFTRKLMWATCALVFATVGLIFATIVPLIRGYAR